MKENQSITLSSSSHSSSLEFLSEIPDNFLEQIASHWLPLFRFLLEHWGQHTLEVAILEKLSAEEESFLRRELELEGMDLLFLAMTQEMADDLFSWLEWHLLDIWGAGEEIGRLALIFYCHTDIKLNLSEVDKRRLAKRFPFPIIFILTPEQRWQRWLERHSLEFNVAISSAILNR